MPRNPKIQVRNKFPRYIPPSPFVKLVEVRPGGVFRWPMALSDGPPNVRLPAPRGSSDKHESTAHWLSAHAHAHGASVQAGAATMVPDSGSTVPAARTGPRWPHHPAEPRLDRAHWQRPLQVGSPQSTQHAATSHVGLRVDSLNPTLARPGQPKTAHGGSPCWRELAGPQQWAFGSAVPGSAEVLDHARQEGPGSMIRPTQATALAGSRACAGPLRSRALLFCHCQQGS
jgi:hypothetical protein